VLTGLQTNICVIFTANEAYMRDLGVVVAPDCCISEHREHHDYAIEQMRTVLKATIAASDTIDFNELTKRAPAVH
jgi:nicotinamidase-related amidase